MTNIMLGNLSIEQIEQRTGIEFPDEIRKYMKDNYQSSANRIEKGKWHCFDIPFRIHCGDIETALLIYNSIKDKSNDLKEPLQFSY